MRFFRFVVLSMFVGFSFASSRATGAEVRAERPWTILVYGAADNSCDGPLQGFLDSVRKAIDDDPAIDVLVLIDRSEAYSSEKDLFGEDFTGCRLYRLKKDSVERLGGGEFLPELKLDSDTEVDSADPALLRRFVAFGKATSPARYTGLMIYSHASGESMCPDEKSGHDMYFPALSEGEGPEAHVDLLALELCNMGEIEAAYQWSPKRPGAKGFMADTMVAIPNVGPPLDWDRAFVRMRSSGHASTVDDGIVDLSKLTPVDFGKLVVSEGKKGREATKARGRDVAHETAACYDMIAAVDVKLAFDTFARALAVDSDRAKDAFFAMRGPGTGAAMNYSDTGPYVDLFDLCSRASKSEALAAIAREAAAAVTVAVDRFVVSSFGMDGYPGFEEGKNGVFVVFPAPGRWRLFPWYTPFEGKGGAFGRFAFLKDGLTPKDGKIDTWFELLDRWFDDNEDGDGGLNEYEP